MKTLCASLLALSLAAPVFAPEAVAQDCRVELIVLGTSQDGGSPQLGRNADPAWEDASLERLVVSLGVVDRTSGERFLFEATPDMRAQLRHLDQVSPPDGSPDLAGVFLTHAHIGHYTGLMFFGHESMGAAGVPVYALPRMQAFLAENGPWSQLVRYGNIDQRVMTAEEPEEFSALRVTAFEVPHRQEFSEVAGFHIEGPQASAIFIPDIDSWEEWDEAGTRIEEMIAAVDVAYLDATFYANGEIPGRDMSGFPHPFIAHSMARFADLPEEERAKVRFIHLNHTNPARYPDSEARTAIEAAGFHVADRDERFCLGSGED